MVLGDAIRLSMRTALRSESTSRFHELRRGRAGKPKRLCIAPKISCGTLMRQAFSNPWKPGEEFASQIR